MYLVKHRHMGIDFYVFLHDDPRREGFDGEVIDDVTLDYDMNAIFLWPDGEDRPEPRLGRDPRDSRHYKVFKFSRDLQRAGFELIHGDAPLVDDTWSHCRDRYFPPPDVYAPRMSEDEWIDSLEAADVAVRIRRRREVQTKPLPVEDRNHVAEWVAKRHIGADGGIQQVWFLPSGAPDDEIRLLEVSEQFGGDETRVVPIDFGLDLDGARYKLLVADVSRDQLGRIKADPQTMLPADWQIDGARIWGRRGRQQ